MSDTLTRPAPKLRVRVWFGEHTIADQTFEAEMALRYAAAMERRFPGLKVSKDRVLLGGNSGTAPMG